MPRRIFFWIIGLVVLAGIGTAGVYWWRSKPPEEAIRPAFEGRSEDLRQTVIVPTLDTPIPEGKSVIWCSSFQLAWNHLKDDIAKGPVLVEGAQALADRLNQAPQSEKDVAAGECYATAGFTKEGIVEKIRAEMREKFPGASPQLPEDTLPGVVAYAYLQAQVRYRFPFPEINKPLVFTDSAGKQASVCSFGLPQRTADNRRQIDTFLHEVRILFPPIEARRKNKDITEYIIDLAQSSTPNQVVLARIKPKASLAATLADVRAKINSTKEKNPFGSGMLTEDTLLVPVTAWRIDHTFSELRRKRLLNPNLAALQIVDAIQNTQFRLDRTGAGVRSEAVLEMKGVVPESSANIDLHFDHPFLIVLQKRTAKEPFFVMWVDNAELLCKWPLPK